MNETYTACIATYFFSEKLSRLYNRHKINTSDGGLECTIDISCSNV